MCIVGLVKLIEPFLTPLTILLIGIFINKKLEKNKIELLKEKDWQISWAKLLFDTSKELNDNISLLIISLFELQNVSGDKYQEKKVIAEYEEYLKKIKILVWNIRNYTQFAIINGDTVVQKQEKLFEQLRTIIDNKQGDIEVVRKTQFEFNDAIRKAHAEILNIKNDK